MSNNYSIDLEKEEITIGGVMYEICELTVAGRDAYLKAVGKTMDIHLVGTGETGADGKEIMRKDFRVLSLDGAQKELCMAAMIQVSEDGVRKPVTSKDIQAWPARILEECAKRASRLNGLKTPDEIARQSAEKN